MIRELLAAATLAAPPAAHTPGLTLGSGPADNHWCLTLSNDVWYDCDPDSASCYIGTDNLRYALTGLTRFELFVPPAALERLATGDTK